MVQKNEKFLVDIFVEKIGATNTGTVEQKHTMSWKGPVKPGYQREIKEEKHNFLYFFVGSTEEMIFFEQNKLTSSHCLKTHQRILITAQRRKIQYRWGQIFSIFCSTTQS